MAATCPTAALTAKVSEEDGLASEDIEQILSVSIVEENLPSCSWPESGTEHEPDNTEIASDSEGGSTDDSTDGDDLNRLRLELCKAKPDGIRHRQLSMLLKNADRLAGRRRFLVDLGVASELQINRRVIDPDEPLPSTQKEMERQACEKREERIQAQKKTTGTRKSEKGIYQSLACRNGNGNAECNRRLEGTEDTEMPTVLMSLLEINSNKLRLLYQNQGTLGKQEALTERKKLCLERRPL